MAQRAAADRCSARSRAVGPPRSAGISIGVTPAGIRPSPTTRVGTGTARSVRRRRASAGSHARERELLDVPYVHVVFTLPHALLPLAYRNSARLYTWLFQTSAATLREVAADPRHLGRRDRRPEHPPHLGADPGPSSARALRRAGRWPVARSSALDSTEVRRLLPAREGPQSRLSREVCRGAAARLRPRRTRPRRRHRAPA